jgi:hypothetical protein
MEVSVMASPGASGFLVAAINPNTLRRAHGGATAIIGRLTLKSASHSRFVRSRQVCRSGDLSGSNRRDRVDRVPRGLSFRALNASLHALRQAPSIAVFAAGPRCAGGGGLSGDDRRLPCGAAAGREGGRRCVSLPEPFVRLHDRPGVLGTMLLLHERRTAGVGGAPQDLAAEAPDARSLAAARSQRPSML